METNNTKGAIEFCKDLKEVRFKYGGIEYDLNPHIDNIIELLQRGEKFEAIYNELEEDYRHLPFSVASSTLHSMRILKEKCFPKPKENPLEELLEKTLWKIIKEFVEKNTSVVLKCMEKAEKDKNENKMEDRPIKQSRMDYMEKGARIGKSREGKNERKTP